MWPCMLMFRPIAIKQLHVNSLTAINKEVTLMTSVQEFPSSIPSSDKEFYVCCFFAIFGHNIHYLDAILQFLLQY